MRLCLVIATKQDERDTVRRTVKKMGLLCVEAEDGEYTYAAGKALMPDFFFADLDDDADRDVVAGGLRRVEKGDQPLIICCMNEKDRQEVLKALRAGADDFVLRPLDFSSLAENFLCSPAYGGDMATRH